MTDEPGSPLNATTLRQHQEYFDTPLVVHPGNKDLVQLYMEKMKKSAGVERLTVCVVGSGNWGSTAAKIIGENVMGEATGRFFDPEVRMWVFEEEVKDSTGATRKLVPALPYTLLQCERSAPQTRTLSWLQRLRERLVLGLFFSGKQS